MPGRIANMATESPEPEAQTGASTRRKSGRVVRKPEHFGASSPAVSMKRKRTDAEEEAAEVEGDASEEEDEEEESEGEADEEELKEKRRRARKAAKPTQRKPAAKKTKTNGATHSLAIRPAGGKAKRPKKAKPLGDAAAEDAEGLYAEVFNGENTLDDVAAQWVESFQNHESQAVADIVNFVLKCAGCDLKVDIHDIEDPDSCTNKLTDIQDEYQAQNITEYPLIAKSKGAASFKKSIIGFFDSLISTVAETGLLFDNIELIENIEVWVSTMSSAGNRPFRHTATVVSLAIVSALCDVGKGLIQKSANALRLGETEKKKSRTNKARIAEFEENARIASQKQEALDGIIKDWFDTVFVHRYRDVDPRIRVDCVQALADWIMTYPDLFFDGHHLRYLGWVLSDSSAPTRLEVVKQLQRLYKDKDKLGGLKTFTERFRGRMVEMATRDAEPNVRAHTVELLDVLREAGLLEPDDVDSVGRLIYDSEPRVRKAVVGFFAENINDMYDEKVEELGGKDTVEEAFSEDDSEDYDNPRIEWLKLKCLVEALQAYNSDDQALPSQIERGPGGTSYALVAAGVESRFSLAAQALYDHVPEIKEWEVLGGYLLFDHSQTVQNGSATDPQTQLKEMCKLSEKEEIILLEILNAAVKVRLTQAIEASTDKKSKKTKAQRQELLETQEGAARHLAVLIPRLLSKFGASPESAAAVLRLEHVLNLEVFEELRQDSTTYAALLDDINKQFLTHASENVLVEASAALKHAKDYEELSEITEAKVQALWEETMNTLHTLSKNRDLSTRGNLSFNVLTAVTNAVLRIANLAGISDCTEPLEALPPQPKHGKGKANVQPSDGINLLTDLVSRGVPGTDIIEETDLMEDVLVTNALKALLFYFMWKVREWQNHIATGTSIPDDDVTALAERRDAFVVVLTQVLEARHSADDLRLATAGTLLDLHILFASLRQARRKAAESTTTARINDDYIALIQDVAPDTQELLAQMLTAAEKAFAKRARRTLEAAEDDEPMDTDEEPESEDEGDAEPADEEARAEKQHGALMAEQRLCEFASKLVLAILAGVVDLGEEGEEEDTGEERTGPMRKRLERNKTRLGPNYKEVVAHLDAAKKGAATGRAKAKPKTRADTAKGKEKARSAEIILHDDDIEDDEAADDEADEEELRRRELTVEDDHMEEENEDAGAGARATEEVESVLGD